MERILKLVLILGSILILSSCIRYRQNILFKVDEDSIFDTLVAKANELEVNYLLKPNDVISVSVYTSNGEILIDPDGKYNLADGNINSGQVNKETDSDGYLIDASGKVNLPMIGSIKVDSLTLPQLDSTLRVEYAKYYDKPFIKSDCISRRVSVMIGNKSQVIALKYENMTLIEVLTLSGGFSNVDKAYKIKLVRYNEGNPKMAIIDLSTIEGIKLANIKIENHDFIYVEPDRKVFGEAIQDASPIITLFTTVTTLVVLFFSISQ